MSRPALSALQSALERERHVSNEWADMATNAIQHIRNIRDGITTPEEALANLAECLAHCEQVHAATQDGSEALFRQIDEKAGRYDVLMGLSGARRRIWNHVLDEEQKVGRRSIEDALDAVTAQAHAQDAAPSETPRPTA